MIHIGLIEVSGLEGALYSMRNPLNSWDKSDSYDGTQFHIGKNDMELCKKLIKAGSDHRKFLRMIHAQFDVIAPLYWYKEMDTYKVATVCNSCSTMHTIHKKELDINDFSHDKLNDSDGSITTLTFVVSTLNHLRDKYLETKDKKYWYMIIQLLPSSYNQRRTYDMNYETLMNIYHQRKNHKLDEWRDFCKWIETFPYMRDFLGVDGKQ